VSDNDDLVVDGAPWPSATNGSRQATSVGGLATHHEDALASLLRAGPTVLLGAGALASEGTPGAARQLLRRDYGLTPDRADAALQAGRTLGLHKGSDPVGVVAGLPLPRSRVAKLRELFGATARERGVRSSTLSLRSVRRTAVSGGLGRIAMAAARSKDEPSLLMATALLASLRHDDLDFAQVLQNSLDAVTSPDEYHPGGQVADRVVGAAYALDAAANGLDLFGRSWEGASPGWRFRAAPWVLAAMEGDTIDALVALLDAVAAHKLDFVAPGQHRFSHQGTPDAVSYASDIAGNANTLTHWSSQPMWFEGSPDGPQILLVDGDEYVYAWVGQSGYGVLVGFDTSEFTAWRLKEPGADYAAAAAIGWYIDMTVSLRRTPKGTRTIARSSAGTERTGPSYKPTPTYQQQRRDVSSGVNTPPRPHSVKGHKRRLPVGHAPNPHQVAMAPKRNRRTMGPRDTWVREFTKGEGGPREWAIRLSKWSALADILSYIDAPSAR
jgi:hypothetical protein